MIWMQLHLVIILLLQLEKEELSVPPQIMDRHGIMERPEQQIIVRNCVWDSTFVTVGERALISILATTELHGVLEQRLKLQITTV